MTGGAVLEYRPTEILPPVGPMLPRPARLCRPRRSPRPHTRGKPRLLDVGRRIPARDRFAPDSPLERDGFEPSVPRRKRRGAYRRYKDLLVRRGPLERWYDFYNNAEEGFAGVVRGETCLRSCTRSRVRASSSSRRIRRALLAGAAFDYQNAREGMDRDRRQQWPSAWGCAGACRASRCQGSL